MVLCSVIPGQSFRENSSSTLYVRSFSFRKGNLCTFPVCDLCSQPYPTQLPLPPTEAINSSVVVSGAQIKGDKQVPRNHEPYQNQRNSTRSGSLAHWRGLHIEVSPTRHFPDRCEPGYYGAVLLGSPDRKGCHPLCKNLKKKEESLLVSLVFTDASVTSNLGYLVATHLSPTGHQSPWSLRLCVCGVAKGFRDRMDRFPVAMMVLRQKS